MPLDIDALNEVDTLRDGPGFDADEFVCLHRIEDAVLYNEALNDSFVRDPRAEDPENANMVVSNAALNRARVRCMVTNWNLWKPPSAADKAAGRTKGAQILYADDQGNPSAENFDKVYRMIGAWLLAKVNSPDRTGAAEVTIPEGMVDPETGEPATFPVDPGQHSA